MEVKKTLSNNQLSKELSSTDKLDLLSFLKDKIENDMIPLFTQGLAHVLKQYHKDQNNDLFTNNIDSLYQAINNMVIVNNDLIGCDLLTSYSLNDRLLAQCMTATLVDQTIHDHLLNLLEISESLGVDWYPISPERLIYFSMGLIKRLPLNSYDQVWAFNTFWDFTLSHLTNCLSTIFHYVLTAYRTNSIRKDMVTTHSIPIDIEGNKTSDNHHNSDSLVYLLANQSDKNFSTEVSKNNIVKYDPLNLNYNNKIKLAHSSNTESQLNNAMRYGLSSDEEASAFSENENSEEIILQNLFIEDSHFIKNINNENLKSTIDHKIQDHIKNNDSLSSSLEHKIDNQHLLLKDSPGLETENTINQFIVDNLPVGSIIDFYDDKINHSLKCMVAKSNQNLSEVVLVNQAGLEIAHIAYADLFNYIQLGKAKILGKPSFYSKLKNKIYNSFLSY